MNKNQIKTEIKKVRKQLEDLEKKLETAKDHSLGDIDHKQRISQAGHNLRDALRAAGLKDTSSAFGEITNGGQYANRSIFLGTLKDNCWKWSVQTDCNNDQVLMRVDKNTGECID